MNVAVSGLWFGWVKINGKVKHFYRSQGGDKALDARKEPNVNKPITRKRAA